MTTPHVPARCGQAMLAHARRSHERHCDACEAIPPKPSPYAVRPCVGCGNNFKPSTSTHRACSAPCGRRKPLGTQPGDVKKEATEMRHIALKRQRMRDREIVSGWALERRRPASWNSWVNCLGLPEAMKEAA